MFVTCNYEYGAYRIRYHGVTVKRRLSFQEKLLSPGSKLIHVFLSSAFNLSKMKMYEPLRRLIGINDCTWKRKER